MPVEREIVFSPDNARSGIAEGGRVVVAMERGMAARRRGRVERQIVELPVSIDLVSIPLQDRHQVAKDDRIG
jgi:hypothetical protein